MVQPPVIVVPGITATNLDDFYPIPPESIWSAVLKKKYDRFALHPDNIRYEAMEPARIRAVSIFELVYDDLVEALRHELRRNDDEPTPVFPFDYDWRQDCTLTAGLLDGFIDEVIARTSLLAHYRDEEFMVDLVGHSMGGLIIADYLRRRGGKGKVRRVVTLGTPFQGAVDAVLKLVIGKGLLSENPRDREREAARTIPAVYQLLPSFPGAVKSIGGAPTDLFDPDTWQPALLKSLARYVKRYQAKARPRVLFRKYLTMAKRLRESVAGLEPDRVLPEKQAGWLAIVGVGAPTQVQIGNVKAGDKLLYRFRVLDDKDDWSDNKKGSTATGDGTVPFKGALPKFLPKEKVVCVSPDDFSRWEIRDRVLAKTAGFHGFLPAVNLVERLVTKFLREDYSGHVWGWKPPTVKKENWSPPDWLEKRY
jgi:pimeloyl-ACP methyl ester carboxylesterase